MAGQFQDQVVVITGGGRGIGRATAIEFAAEGADTDSRRTPYGRPAHRRERVPGGRRPRRDRRAATSRSTTT